MLLLRLIVAKLVFISDKKRKSIFDSMIVKIKN